MEKTGSIQKFGVNLITFFSFHAAFFKFYRCDFERTFHSPLVNRSESDTRKQQNNCQSSSMMTHHHSCAYIYSLLCVAIIVFLSINISQNRKKFVIEFICQKIDYFEYFNSIYRKLCRIFNFTNVN